MRWMNHLKQIFKTSIQDDESQMSCISFFNDDERRRLYQVKKEKKTTQIIIMDQTI
jgi:hypothetical protein